MKKNALFLALALLTPAVAQTAAPKVKNPILKLEQYDVQKVVVNGKTTEKLTLNKGNVFPGALLSQQVNVTNPNTVMLPLLEVKLPVPKETVFVGLEPLAPGVTAQYSIDGGKTFAPAPLKKKVTVTENGKKVIKEVEVKPNEYTAVRWTIKNLKAGGNLKVGFRIQVR